MNKIDFFSINIKLLRLQIGKTQAEMSVVTGITQAAWSEYEQGTSKPRFNDLMKIIDYFCISASELLQLDLEKLNPNEILEFRKLLKKLNPNLNVSLNLNYETTLEQSVLNEDETKISKDVLQQLSKMEEEIKQMRRKLGQ